MNSLPEAPPGQALPHFKTARKWGKRRESFSRMLRDADTAQGPGTARGYGWQTLNWNGLRSQNQEGFNRNQQFFWDLQTNKTEAI